ncbi:MAG: hypothetical protein ACR2F6_01260 [Mycobacteriales bacterium]
MVPLRINMSKVLSLRLGGTPDRMPLSDFYVALRGEPRLYGEWEDGLRLAGTSADVESALAVTHDVLATVGDVLTKTSVSLR